MDRTLKFKSGGFRSSKELDQSLLPAYSYKLEMSVSSLPKKDVKDFP